MSDTNVNQSTHGVCTLCVAILLAEPVPSAPEATHQSKLRQSIPDNSLAAEELGKRWKNGQTLRIFFINGTEREKDKVREYAPQWTQYANLQFDFVDEWDDASPPEIRIAFNSEEENSSNVGTDSLLTATSSGKPKSMSLGIELDPEKFSPDRMEATIRRHILHEFGHALGLIHEHMRPDIKNVLPFKSDQEIIDWYLKNSNWTKKEIEDNVTTLYTRAQLGEMSPDPDLKSIMLYSVRAEMTTNNTAVEGANELSQVDKDTVARMYPGK
jgi:hypothetical protein